MHVLIRRGMFVATCILLCAAPGCSFHSKWFGPSLTFRSLDLDKDSVISRTEWGEPSCTLRGKETSEECQKDRRMRLGEFTCMDTNRDGVVTWSEYYDLLFANTTRCDYFFAPSQGPTQSHERSSGVGGGAQEAVAEHRTTEALADKP